MAYADLPVLEGERSQSRQLVFVEAQARCSNVTCLSNTRHRNGFVFGDTDVALTHAAAACSNPDSTATRVDRGSFPVGFSCSGA